MAVDFKNSVTKDNLMRAFAGESQARNRYTFAADTAKANKLPLVEQIFTFTANQEKEHAEIFFNHLKELAGENIAVDGSYPVEAQMSVAMLLRGAQHNEYEEYQTVYPSFAQKAEEEGFPAIAASFRLIAEIEKTHGDRFAKFAEYMEQNQLFISQVECGWMCLNCGHIYTGTEVPEQCPVCHHEKGYFIRVTLAPFSE